MSRGKIKISEVFSLRGRAVPGDRWRAHFASPRRAGWIASSVCALTFAGMFSEITRFFRLRGWRTRGLRSRPLVNHPAPKARSPPLDSTPPQVQPPFYSGSSVQWGITPHPFLITGVSSALGSQRRTKYAQRREYSLPRQTFTSKGAAGMCSVQACRLAVHSLPRRSRKG